MAGWIRFRREVHRGYHLDHAGAFGGNPPSYSAIGFDGAGNYYYKKNSQGAMYTEVYEVPAGSTSNAQQVTMTPPGAADHGVAVNSDGSLLFGCEILGYSWLNANTVVMSTGHPDSQSPARRPIKRRMPEPPRGQWRALTARNQFRDRA